MKRERSFTYLLNAVTGLQSTCTLHTCSQEWRLKSCRKLKRCGEREGRKHTSDLPKAGYRARDQDINTCYSTVNEKNEGWTMFMALKLCFLMLCSCNRTSCLQLLVCLDVQAWSSYHFSTLHSTICTS